MSSFRTCPACGADAWTIAYQGDVRLGQFPQMTLGTVMRCDDCGLKGLDAPEIDYSLSNYRELVDVDSSTNGFHRLHDPEIPQRLSFADLPALRGRVVADVGCGGGSFLDAVGGIAARTLAIEPARQYHDALRKAGHEVFSFAADASKAYEAGIDVVTTFAVIEHIEDPFSFIRDIVRLLKPGGRLVISTPNARDWLLDFLPGVFERFFYRFVHRWYFDALSLQRLLARAGLVDVGVSFHQTYDISNALLWARDGRPTGLGKTQFLSGIDGPYRRELEQTGRADTLVVRATRTQFAF